MASITRYYDYDKTAISYYTILDSLDTHFKNMLFKGDVSRIVTAKNNYALRARADQNQVNSSLNIPFMNYKRLSWDFDSDINKWQVELFSRGIFIDELENKLKLNPVIFEYEGTLWYAREDDLVHAFRTMRMDADNLTELDFSIMIDGHEVALNGWLTYSSLDFDPDYDESDWLEQNKIRTIALDFSIQTFDVEPSDNTPLEFALTEKVVFNYIQKYNLPEDFTSNEVVEFLIEEEI